MIERCPDRLEIGYTQGYASTPDTYGQCRSQKHATVGRELKIQNPRLTTRDTSHPRTASKVHQVNGPLAITGGEPVSVRRKPKRHHLAGEFPECRCLVTASLGLEVIPLPATHIRSRRPGSRRRRRRRMAVEERADPSQVGG